MTEKKSKYLPGLMGLRAIAVWLVYFEHYQDIIFKEKSPKLECYIAMVAFFVLSGFLITYRYYGRLDVKQYLRNRYSRLYPVYLILLTISFLYFPADPSSPAMNNSPLVYFLNYSLLTGFFFEARISQTWSLTVEETFYVLAPFLFFLSAKKRVYPFLFCLLLLGFSLFLAGKAGLFLPRPRMIFVATFMGRAFEFLAGMTLALIVRGEINLTLPKWNYTALGIIGVLIYIPFLMLIRGNTHSFATPQGTFMNNLVAPLIVCVLMYGLVTEKTPFRDFLSTPFMELLGKSTYAFYLIHIGVIQILISSYFSNPITHFVLLWVIAILIYKFIEDPIHRKLSKNSIS